MLIINRMDMKSKTFLQSTNQERDTTHTAASQYNMHTQKTPEYTQPAQLLIKAAVVDSAASDIHLRTTSNK